MEQLRQDPAKIPTRSVVLDGPAPGYADSSCRAGGDGSEVSSVSENYQSASLISKCGFTQSRNQATDFVHIARASPSGTIPTGRAGLMEERGYKSALG